MSESISALHGGVPSLGDGLRVTCGQIEGRLRAFFTELYLSLNLPHPPEDGRCGCGATEWSLYEPGYRRVTKTYWSNGCWVGCTDGWDDMSDEGYFTLLQCASCGLAYYIMPDEVEWE